MIFVHPVQTSRLDAILSSNSFQGATVCATVTDETGKILYDRNGSLRVSPASNEKLFSTSFALYTLGPDFRPTTKVWADHDRIVVESEGDPTLSHDDLVAARKALQTDGSLPVFVKQSYDPEIPDGWEFGDLPNRYAAPVAAFSVDQSGFELWNSDGKLQLKPEPYGVRIKHEHRNSGAPGFTYDPIKRIVKAHGKFPKKTERLDTLAVPNALQAACSLLGHGCTPVTDTPTDSPTYSIVGKPLSTDLGLCLQHSDNNMAENFLLMAARRMGELDQESPYDSAIKQLTDFETRVVGLSSQDVAQRDGSGMTRANSVTTHAVVNLLNWSRTQPTFSLWNASLASPGVGTLTSRLHGINFHGKTGSLSHVTALSGYLVTSGSRNLTVSVIINNFSCSESQAHAVVDKFLGFISQNGL